MADATIYGNIDQAYSKSRTTVAGTQTKSTTGMSSYQMGSSQVGVKGEEDLGGGLKASFLHELGVTTEANDNNMTTRQSYVGLSGGFGAVRIGKQYSNAFGNLISADPFGATGGSGSLYVGNVITGNGPSPDNPLRQDDAIQYDLPTLVPGVRIGITKVFAGADTGNGSGAKTADSTGYAIQYASGPLNVGFTSDSIKAQSIAGIKGSAASGSVATGALVTTAAVAGVTAAASSTTKLTTVAAGYDLGMVKITYHDAKIMNNGRGIKTNMTGIAVPMGAATLMYTSGSGTANTLGGDTQLKGTQYGANYALSKRTVAYLHANNSTSTTAAKVATKVNGYGLGIHHSF
jgi:predicted porin